MSEKIMVLFLISAFLLSGCGSPSPSGEESGSSGEKSYTDVAVLSTTDMHGKCWHTDILSDTAVSENMLKVSTAAESFRSQYGEENVILIDNGDLFQGGTVSEVQLRSYLKGASVQIPAMALCLKEAGYDAFVPGNHEFNYDFAGMKKIYADLEENGIPVLAANICFSEDSSDHKAGDMHSRLTSQKQSRLTAMSTSSAFSDLKIRIVRDGIFLQTIRECSLSIRAMIIGISRKKLTFICRP